MVLTPTANGYVPQPHPIGQRSNVRPNANAHSRRGSLPLIQTGVFPVSNGPISAPPGGPSPRAMVPSHAGAPITHVIRSRSQHSSPITSIPPSAIALPVPTNVPSIAGHPTQVTQQQIPLIAAPIPGPALGPIPSAISGWHKRTNSSSSSKEIIDLTDLDNDEAASTSEVARKKRRIDSPESSMVLPSGDQSQPMLVQSPTAVTSSETLSTNSASVTSPSEEVVPNGDIQMQPAEDQAEEDVQDPDEMEVEVELDEDGLIPADYCANEAFTPDKGQGRECRMCK